MYIPLTRFDDLNKEGVRYILEHVVRNDNRIGTMWTKGMDVGEAIGPMLAKVSVARSTIVAGRTPIARVANEVRLASHTGTMWINTFDAKVCILLVSGHLAIGALDNTVGRTSHVSISDSSGSMSGYVATRLATGPSDIRKWGVVDVNG